MVVQKTLSHKYTMAGDGGDAYFISPSINIFLSKVNSVRRTLGKGPIKLRELQQSKTLRALVSAGFKSFSAIEEGRRDHATVQKAKHSLDRLHTVDVIELVPLSARDVRPAEQTRRITPFA